MHMHMHMHMMCMDMHMHMHMCMCMHMHMHMHMRMRMRPVFLAQNRPLFAPLSASSGSRRSRSSLAPLVGPPLVRLVCRGRRRHTASEMTTAIITAAILGLRATPPSSFTPSPQPAAASYQSPFAQDALSLLFPSPVLRVNLEEVLGSGTLDALEEAILNSWDEHCAEQATLPQTDTARATTEGERMRAASDQELNEEFFYYQRSKYGVDGQQRSEASPSPGPGPSASTGVDPTLPQA